MKKLAIMILAIFLTSCAEYAKEGEIISKDHQEAYTSTWMMCMAYNAQSMCTVWMPMEDYHPARWTITFRDDDPETEDGTADISEELWRKYQIGNYYRPGAPQ